MDLKVCLLSAVLVERRFCVEIRICNFSKCQQRWWNSWWTKVEEVVKVKEEEEEEEERNNFFCPQLGHRRPPPSFSFESLPPPHLPPPVLQPQLALLAVVLAAATTRLYYYAHPYRLTYTQLSLSLSLSFRFSLQLFDTKKNVSLFLPFSCCVHVRLVHVNRLLFYKFDDKSRGAENERAFPKEMIEKKGGII